MSIASEIQALNTNLTAAKNAVTSAGGTVGDTGLAGLASEIGTIPTGGGGGEVESKYIDFYDYDGTRLYSWTKQELDNATELPENPTHAGLTSRGWNWTLAELREQGTPMDVGQMYKTNDDKTHLFVEVDADHLTPHLAIGLNGTATVDWGDGSTTDTLTGTSILTGVGTYHTYAQAGSYEVTIDIPVGSVGNLRGNIYYVSYIWKGDATQQNNVATPKNIAYGQQLKEVWVGPRLNFGYGTGYPFNYQGIRKIIISEGASGATYVSSVFTFYSNCPNIEYFVIPKGWPNINYATYMVFGKKGASYPYGFNWKLNGSVTVNNFSTKRFCLPKTLTYNFNFSDSPNVKEIYIPEGITTISGMSPSNIHYVKYPSTITTAPMFKAGTWVVHDFTALQNIPALSSGSDTAAKLDGLVIKVPAALEEDWKADASWSALANYIVGV